MDSVFSLCGPPVRHICGGQKDNVPVFVFCFFLFKIFKYSMSLHVFFLCICLK